MDGGVKRQEGCVLKPNPHCLPEREINILILGQTGVGKSTFINAFANYIINDTFTEAVNYEMQVIISSSFSCTDPETFNTKMIVLSKEDDYEQFKNVGQSNTQQCESFVFPIGDRNLRFINTPGIGDTRGIEKDAENFREILTYIARYKHLNGVFIVLKPNEERLTVIFRYSFNELLRHLHVGAKDNIVFVFTNARSTFFMPGSTKKCLQGLLDDHRQKHNIDVPFSKENTFLLDNESFRSLALSKNGIRFNNEETQSHIQSWNHSVKEYSRLMKHIVTRPLHIIRDILSLDEAEQLVRKLSHSITETTKLIEENIQLAKESKKHMLRNPGFGSRCVQLAYPRIVCASKKCSRVVKVGNENKMEYLSICHDECYVKGVEPERLNDPKLEDCEVMDLENGFCKVCNCHWSQHKQIIYEYKTYRIHFHSINGTNTATDRSMSVSDIDSCLSGLREEVRQMVDIYKKLAKIVYANAILPTNDVFLEYLQHFIREEQKKRNAGARNAEDISRREETMAAVASDMELFKKALQDQTDTSYPINTPEPEDVFTLVDALYRLPISGKQFRDQVEGIKINQGKYGAHRENFVELPAKAASSKIMLQFKGTLSAT